MTWLQRTREIWGSVTIVEGMMCVFSALGQAERAARLWGTMTRFQELHGFGYHPSVLLDYSPHIDAARAQLGDVAFEATVAEGRKMTLDQAVEYALTEE